MVQVKSNRITFLTKHARPSLFQSGKSSFMFCLPLFAFVLVVLLVLRIMLVLINPVDFFILRWHTQNLSFSSE